MRGGVGRGVKVLAEALVGVDGEAESPFEEIELGGLVPVSKKFGPLVFRFSYFAVWLTHSLLLFWGGG